MKKRCKGVFLQLWCWKLCSKTDTLTVFSVNVFYSVYYVSFVFSYIYVHTHTVYLLGLEVSYPMPLKILHIFKRAPFSVQR